MPLQIRRGTEAERLAMTVPLAPGEPLFTTDPGQQRLYIGNGTDLGGVLVSGYGNEDAIDAVGVALSNGVHQNITFTYSLTQDINNRIDASIDLSNYQGIITADAIKGSIFAEDSSLLVDVADSKINLDGTVKGNIIPDTNENYDIGSPAFRFKDLYLSGSSLYLGNAQITASGSSVNLPAGSTIDGAPLSTLVPGNNYNINIIADDSALIVNSADATITGSFFGDIKGSVFGDDSTILIDSVSNIISNGTLTFSESTIISINDDIIVGDTNQRNNLFLYNRNSTPGIQINAELSGAPGITQLGPAIRLASTKGTFDSPTVLGSGDLLGQLQYAGYVNGGSTGNEVTGDLIAIRAVVDDAGDLISNFASAKLQFFIADQDNPIDSKIAEFSNNGAFSAPILKTGTYADALARDSAIPSPQIGMIIFLTSTTKFQGNTDGTTGGWVDLN
jgi:hypothetical protein